MFKKTLNSVKNNSLGTVLVLVTADFGVLGAQADVQRCALAGTAIWPVMSYWLI